jgi:hypothetical protein
MSLKQNHQKIKSFYPVLNILIVTLILMLGSSFLYLYEILYYKDDIKYYFNAFEVPNLEVKHTKEEGINDFLLPDGEIVASKNGTKYYYQGCSGLNRIKQENRVYFSDFRVAEEAGYELAKNCEKQ